MKAKKGRKGNQADALYAKKTKVIAKKVNPFELHSVRDKFNILNRQKKHSLGRPTVSRSLALEKRKQTLGVEFKEKNKVNVFQDNRKASRIGGGFQAPKQSIYNLNESEVLTHGGQTLAEIERFDDHVHEEDEMSDDEARLDGREPMLCRRFHAKF
jgi:nucleolar protein 14